MWPTIRNTLLRFLLGILDPGFKAELDAFEQLKATKQREREALQGEIAEIERQIAAARTRQIEAQAKLESHVAEANKIESLIQKVTNEEPINTSRIDASDALRDQL